MFFRLKVFQNKSFISPEGVSNNNIEAEGEMQSQKNENRREVVKFYNTNSVVSCLKFTYKNLLLAIGNNDKKSFK